MKTNSFLRCVCARIRAVIPAKVISGRVHRVPADGHIHWHSAMTRHSLRQLAPIIRERSSAHTHSHRHLLSMSTTHTQSAPLSEHNTHTPGSLSLVLTARCNDEEMIALNEVCFSPVHTETALLPIGRYRFSQNFQTDHHTSFWLLKSSESIFFMSSCMQNIQILQNK